MDLHHRRSSLSLPTLPSHAADPSRPILHLTAHPTLTSLVLHLTADPSSISDLSFIVDPSSTGTAFIELKSVVNFVAVTQQYAAAAMHPPPVVFVDKNTRVICQGIKGKNDTFHTKQAIE
nr:succinate--coa ligase [adp-forming] subunit alpha-2, mitochondrial [Quercus suber]